MPIFFALFNVINNASKGRARGLLDAADAASLKEAVFLGGRIADTFMNSTHLETKIIAMVMVVAMCATQFITQRQLMAKNMPPDALTGPYAQQQKILLYILPVVFAVSGVAFPIGVLIYWTVSNIWTMAQQFYVIRRNPAPGTPAFHAKQLRDAKHGRVVQEDPLEELEHPHPQPPARQQPRNQSRNQRKKKGGKS
jgi:YidC/Oxa1 family membrane protein insertase